jgi:hypothetical protein
MAAKYQIKMHVGCLLHGNILKPIKAWFHLKGIGRAIRQILL